MHIVGVLGRDLNLLSAVSRFRDPLGRFHLHPVRESPVEPALQGLIPLEFAGALLFEPEFEEPARRCVQRTSLDAQELGRVDAVTVAAGGLIGDYLAGRAVGSLLTGAGWDARGARAVLLGSGKLVASAARELSSLGASQVVILASDRPAAEQSRPKLAASTEVVTTAQNDPRLENYLAQADLIVRVDPSARVPVEFLGPHLSVVDLHPDSVTHLRHQASELGALTLGQVEYQAQRLALGLSSILGADIATRPLLDLLGDAAA